MLQKYGMVNIDDLKAKIQKKENHEIIKRGEHELVNFLSSQTPRKLHKRFLSSDVSLSR